MGNIKTITTHVRIVRRAGQAGWNVVLNFANGDRRHMGWFSQKDNALEEALMVAERYNCIVTSPKSMSYLVEASG